MAGSAPLGDPWLRALSVNTLRSGDHGIETVVISAPNLKPRQPFTLDFTLGRNSELSIESKTENVRVVIQSPALSKFALGDSPSLNCRGYLADKNRCRLQADGKHWCAGRREQHELLYVELLKPMSELVIAKDAGFIRGEATQLQVYRILQQMIALRTLITHLCYGEHNEDDGHRDAVAVLVDARFQLGRTMGLRQNTGARDAVKTFIFQFLAQAETREREFQPGKKTGQHRETINLQHVRKMLPMLQVVATNAPTLSEVFCPSNPPALLNGILAVIDSAAVGDLPSLPPPPTFPEPLTMEEIFK
ncbi:hypothetical protein BT67DRAFT_144211 [Trichocladium antarcticum]|uniref:Uncharacterized protein n=1 Tax=Trichocladium antarcticum TaxID=1450529 RepID=A0AAN6UER0_9PEZI|nr:hypothetical protein BT67DRAFT_144211 [Trichocladium antarcticum]